MVNTRWVALLARVRRNLPREVLGGKFFVVDFAEMIQRAGSGRTRWPTNDEAIGL